MSIEWEESQRIVIGYLFLKGEARDVREAKAILYPEFFTENRSRLWGWITAYEQRYEEILTLDILRNLARLKKWSEARLLEVEQEVVACEEEAEGKSKGEFSYYVERLADVYREVSLAGLLSEAAQKNHQKGFFESRDMLLKGLSELEKTSVSYEAEVELSDETDAFIQSIKEAKLAHAQSIFFGLPSVDNAVMGLRNGDLCLVAGFTGVGKTAFCVSTAVDVCYRQKKNVVYITTETTMNPLTRRVYARVSRLPMFKNPIKLSNMKAGKLSSEDIESLDHINKFMKKGDHGRFVLVQAPPGADLAWLRGRLLQYEGSFNIELVILDDLRNMIPSTGRRNEWEEFNELLKGSKSLARTHAGRGVPLISPYQISREGQKGLDSDRKRYKLTDLSSSSEAERSPDLVISLIPEEGDNLVYFQIMKQRDGETGREFQLNAEFEYQHFTERGEGITDL